MFQNIGTHISESSDKTQGENYGIDLQMIFVCNSSPDTPLEVLHMDSAVRVMVRAFLYPRIVILVLLMMNGTTQLRRMS